MKHRVSQPLSHSRYRGVNGLTHPPGPVKRDSAITIKIGLSEQSGIGTPKGKNGLIRVSRNNKICRITPHSLHQAKLQGVKMLRIVNKKMTDSCLFSG
jgi:hypothetical protein